MDRDSKGFASMMRVFEGLPRQGPGSKATTIRAIRALPAIGANSVIYDLGCGPGRASMILAGELQQKIISVDLSEAAVVEVRVNAAACGLSHLIESRCGDMCELQEDPESVDLIWAEGSIYCVGFDNGLKQWRPFLKPEGLVACTELSWLTAHPSSEAKAFWAAGYPGARSVAENIIASEGLGFACLQTFILPVSCWWDEYYTPLLWNIERLTPEAKTDEFLFRAISDISEEIELYRRFHEDYGFVFYLLKKSNIVVRAAAASDAHELAAVYRESFRAALPSLPTLHTPDEDAEFIAEQVLAKNEVYVACDQSAKILGFIAFNDEWVEQLYLLPNYTNGGLGTRLLNIAKARHAKLKLWAFQINEIARRFYSKHGFKLIKETDGAGNEEKEPDALYEWSKV